eukprot:6191380-Pleurochrysis_carterae.AAC.1
MIRTWSPFRLRYELRLTVHAPLRENEVRGRTLRVALLADHPLRKRFVHSLTPLPTDCRVEIASLAPTEASVAPAGRKCVLRYSLLPQTFLQLLRLLACRFVPWGWWAGVSICCVSLCADIVRGAREGHVLARTRVPTNP